LVVFAVVTAVHALRSARRAIATWSVLAGLFVIGAGLNSASFLDFAHNINSLIMALLGLAAICWYATALMLLGTPSSLPDSETVDPSDDQPLARSAPTASTRIPPARTSAPESKRPRFRGWSRPSALPESDIWVVQ
jgi:hypothetical protein